MSIGAVPKLGPASSSFLDLCRGLSASVVLLAHAQSIFHIDIHLPVYGSFGVAIFFLLSGFLITISLARHLQKDNSEFHVFLSDRFARIATPFLPVLLIVAILNLFFIQGNWGQPQGVNRGLYALLGNALFLADYPMFQVIYNHWNISDYYVRPYNSAEPFWTVPIEFWIYIFVGLSSFISLGRRKLNPLLAGTGLALSAPVIIWNSFAGGAGSLTLIWFLGSAFGFLWIVLQRSPAIKLEWVGLALLLYGIVCLTGRILKVSFNPYEVQTAVLMASVMFGVSFLLQPLSNENWGFGKVARGMASYSYSLYLVHNTVIVIMYEHSQARFQDFIWAVVLAHLFAIISYYLFERWHKFVSIAIQPWLLRISYADEKRSRAETLVVGNKQP
jgi:peptidoglycan/LPS O-acetylase OafA/YrhL